MKKYKANSGDKVVIEIKRKKAQPQPKVQSQHKAMIGVRQDDPYLGRRRARRFKYRIFDGGRLASGFDIPYSYAPEVTLDDKKYPTETSAFSTTQYNALQDYFLTQDPEDLASTFAEITEDVIVKYNIRMRDKTGILQGFAPGVEYTFKDHGFKYEDGAIIFDGSSDNYEIRSQLCADIYPGNVIDPEDLKITSEPDPNAESVPFSFKKNTDWFMIPRIEMELGRTFVNFTTFIDDVGYATYRTGILNLIYKPLPRELFLTDYFTPFMGQITFDLDAFELARSICEETADSRLLINTTRAPEAGDDTVFIDNSEAAASQFPLLSPTTPPYTYAAAGIRYYSPIFSGVPFPVDEPPFSPDDDLRHHFCAVTIDDPPEWQLAAIAKQKDEVFYLWYRSEGFNGVFFGTSNITVWGYAPS